MKTKSIIPIFLITILIGVSLIQSCQKENETLMPSKEDTAFSIIGTWELVEFKDYNQFLREWTYPYGKEVKGYFTYTESNILNLNISHEEPINENSPLINEKFTIDELSWYTVGYFGKYTVDYEQSIIIHKVEGGGIPDYIGTDQERPFFLRGDTLIIGKEGQFERVLVKVD